MYEIQWAKYLQDKCLGKTQKLNQLFMQYCQESTRVFSVFKYFAVFLILLFITHVSLCPL